MNTKFKSHWKIILVFPSYAYYIFDVWESWIAYTLPFRVTSFAVPQRMNLYIPSVRRFEGTPTSGNLNIVNILETSGPWCFTLFHTTVLVLKTEIIQQYDCGSVRIHRRYFILWLHFITIQRCEYHFIVKLQRILDTIAKVFETTVCINTLVSISLLWG